jgi:hypothetical protein
MSACMRAVSTRTPRSTRARSSGRCCAPRSKSSAYAPTALTGVRSSCEATQTALGFLLLRERVLDALQHRVQGDAEAPDLGAFVGVGDARAQLAAGDLRGRSLDVAQGPQTDAHQPQAEPDRDEQHAGGHDDLRQQQAVQRRVHVGEWERDHQHRIVRQPFGTHAELSTPFGRGDSEEGLALVAVRGETRHVIGETGAGRRELTPGRPAHERVTVRRAQLHVRAGRRRRQRGRVSAGTAFWRPEQRADEGPVRSRQALVDALEEERTQRRVRRDVGCDQTDEGDSGDGEEEAGP